MVKEPSWRRSRYGFALGWLASLIAVWLLLRLICFFAFKSASTPGLDLLRVFITGLFRDLFVGLLLTLPLLGWLWILPERRFPAKWHRLLFWSTCFVFWFVQLFLLFVEYFFFEEFKSRFNTVAVDYLLYPHEVFVNIWQSYHVGIVLTGCVVLSVAWVLVARQVFYGMWERPFHTRTRLLYLVGAIVLVLGLSPAIPLKGVHVSHERTLNELANNGALAFVAAAWTRHLDYGAYYYTIPRAEAYQRARTLLAEGTSEFLEERESIRRRISGDPNRPRLNVVLFLEESLGSEFWGCLGRPNTLTPEMDRLATQEGMLFTNIYASGNRTVRGMEGVLSSFPPLPGDSIVKRDLSDNVETIARVLMRDGYATLFLYGGRGLFDGMRSFALRNGYERFIEQKHFEHPTFTTIWGVCDEDLFDRAIVECRALSQSGNPFFTTVLSVSNHKPYTYPKGRIAEDPDQRKRENAVKYSDYALGQFFRAARKESFWTNTIFMVVADHGARVYGQQSIPIHSYEIPLVIAGPAVVKGPSRQGVLGCSLDVAPTILGLIGRPYDSMFFGHDLLRCAPKNGRALLNHNRDIGMLKGDRLAVLGLMQLVEFYSGNPKEVEMSLLPTPDEAARELQQETAALFQVADDLYVHRQYHIDSNALPARQSPSLTSVSSPPPATLIPKQIGIQ
jgi:phosphoglycerol transferase MdoB-like AlkP superfamily enzyme